MAVITVNSFHVYAGNSGIISKQIGSTIFQTGLNDTYTEIPSGGSFPGGEDSELAAGEFVQNTYGTPSATYSGSDIAGNSYTNIPGNYTMVIGTYNDGVRTFLVTLQVGGSGGSYVLESEENLTAADYPASFDTANINTSTPYVFCFLAGTQIAVQDGSTAVEHLAIGDVVASVDGKYVPVKWIGRQTVSTRFGPAERLMPVRFAAGSLGDGLPHSDLTVTADHGMLVDGVICHAGALVNGTTIIRVPLAEMGESYTVYHIETEEHEIILANGASAETFIDNVSRRVFDNYAEFEALYGDVPEMEELPYPRAMSARQVPERIAQSLAIRKVA